MAASLKVLLINIYEIERRFKENRGLHFTMNRSYLEGKAVGMDSRIITIKDMYRLGYLRKFALSLLPSTTPNISNEKDAVKLIANQVQHMYTNPHTLSN